ncbi:hypothetical protein ACA910_007163 [Epithemia clementina (nom. ined.)]
MYVNTKEQKMTEEMSLDAMSPQANPPKLPTLQQYGIPATNKQVVSRLVRDIARLDESQGEKHALLHSSFENGKKIVLVRVTPSPNWKLLGRNIHATNWIEEILQGLGPQDLK